MRGGPSPEYEVSLKTGSVIASNLPDDCEVLDIWISKDGVWHMDGFEKSPERILRGVDIVINALHGTFGEDGQIQKILDHHGVPYTGSGAIASSIAMNKKLAKQSFSKFGLKTPHSITVIKHNGEPTIAELRDFEQKIYESLPFPVVIKPVNLGSSIGVSFVKQKEGLSPALKTAFQYSSEVLVEEFINGIEVTSGVIEDFRGSPFYTLMPISIPKTNPIHDYESKYSTTTGFAEASSSQSKISNIQKMQVEAVARQVHELLHLRDYSRTDMIIHPRRGIFVLEVNTLPEITHRSSFVKSLEALGSNVKEFLSHLVHKALNRN